MSDIHNLTDNIAIDPRAGPIGAVIRGVDLNEMNAKTADRIRDALKQHLVLFFHDQSLTPRLLKEVAKSFGEPTPYPYVEGLPELPEVIEVRKEPEDEINFGGVWHSDTAYLKTPAMGAILYAEIVPENGGDTLFANMYEAYRRLSPGLQKFLLKLNAVNDADKAQISATRPDSSLTSGERGLKAIHPVVRAHPDTGLPLLYVNRAHTTRFENMTVDESQPLLDHLFQIIETPDISCRFSWQEGSVAFWDNRACQHFPLNDYQGQRRLMFRISLQGDQPKPYSD